MQLRTVSWAMLLALAGAALHGQPIAVPGTQPSLSGPVYWSVTAPDCSSLAGESPVAITNAGATVGYACYVSGAFVWFAAGGGWSSAIRVAAPTSAAIGVDYSFFDGNGNSLNVDNAAGGQVASRNDVNFALAANQPAEIALLGASSDAPKYASTATGTAYAVFYCPDAATCAKVMPQLLYSAVPGAPWTLSVPVAWDTALATQWSAVGVDDGAANRVSLVIYNEDIAPASYRIWIFDSTGKLAGSGATPPVAPLQALANGAYGEGAAYAAMLSAVVTTPLPTGPFKMVIDGGSAYSAVEVLQFNGASATALQVGYDSPPAATSANADIRRSRTAGRPKPVFRALTGTERK